jgi:hypothetical protein
MRYDPVLSPPEPDVWPQLIQDAKSDNTLQTLREGALSAYKHFKLTDEAKDADHPLHALWNNYLNAIDAASTNNRGN